MYPPPLRIFTQHGLVLSEPPVPPEVRYVLDSKSDNPVSASRRICERLLLFRCRFVLQLARRVLCA